MRLLLDTHVFLWFLADSPRLKKAARRQIETAEQVFVSAASIWEATIKAALGKLDLDGADLVQEIDANGFLELPVTARHAAMVATLPSHHHDPFDRLLVSQALSEPLRLLTGDAILQQYPAIVDLV